MYIKKILSQHRRDFLAIFVCEHCNKETKMSGYDDTYFHQDVIPNMICKTCGKKASKTYRGLAPKHADSMVI